MLPKRLSPEDLESFLLSHDLKGEVLRLDSPTPTVETAAQAVGVQADAIVKSILFLVNDRPVLAVASGLGLVDRRLLAGLFGVSRKKIHLASPDTVLEISGYEVGAMPPFGHHSPLETILDPAVLAQEIVYAGGGAENALMRIASADILKVTNARVVPVMVSPNPQIPSP